MEKLRLSVSLNFSAIILSSIILLTSNFYLILACIVILAIHLNFVYFPFLEKGFNANSFKRVAYFITLMLLSVAASNVIPININALSNVKIGLFFGLVLSTITCDFLFKNIPGFNEKTYRFTDSTNYYSAMALFRVFLISLISTIIFYCLVSEFLQIFQDWVLLMIVLLAIFIHMDFYKIWQNLRTKHLLNHKIGLVFILIATFMLFSMVADSFIHFLILYIYLIGIILIQSSTIDKNSDLRKNYFHSFATPSLLFISMLATIYYLYPKSTESINIAFLPAKQGETYRNLKNYEKDLEKNLNERFNALKEEGKIPINAKPVIDFELKINKSMFSKTTVDLKGTFTYNYEELFKETIENYPLGTYDFENSNITKIIINGFKIAINNHLSNYLEEGRNVDIGLFGSSDAIGFSEDKHTEYNGEYGQQINEKVKEDDDQQLKTISIETNQQLNHKTLAFLRCFSIKDFIQNNIAKLKLAKTQYYYNIFNDKNNAGSQYRRVKIEINIYDILKNK